MSELVKNFIGLDLLYSCINVTIFKLVNMIILVLKIIFKLIEYSEFLYQFIKTNRVARICFVPPCLVFFSYASFVLSKIIKNPTFRENVRDYVLNLAGVV
ncbi:hypothetical protein MXB_1667 [Myxobolus squamalis]|nr:hypothetical protein MXB_1667 [Myxobolus squamalis]